MTRLGTHLLALALLLGALVGSGAADERTLVVITHPSRPVVITTSDLRRFFLKQRRFWPDGTPVIPINRTAATAVRAAFDRSVFGTEAAGLAAYWNQRYFEGLFPPITLDSDEAVQRYVAARPNAIGYVDAASVDGSVHVALRLAERP
jgi:ABC-type phosphate transport system substrate-binding protein